MGFYPSWNCQPYAHYYASVGQEQAWVVFSIELKPPKGRLQEGSLNQKENNKTSPQVLEASLTQSHEKKRRVKQKLLQTQCFPIAIPPHGKEPC